MKDEYQGRDSIQYSQSIYKETEYISITGDTNLRPNLDIVENALNPPKPP